MVEEGRETKVSEVSSEADRVPIGALIYVLRYDDLLGPSAALPLLGRLTPALYLQRDPSLQMQSRQIDAKHVYLPDPYMSAEHARVERRGVVDVIKDLGSKHGTFVNGHRVEGERILNDGDLIEIGHSLLAYRHRLVDADTRIWLAAREAGVKLGLTVTRAPASAVLAARLVRFAPTTESIMIFGERGSGKEGVAAHVHEQSGRKGLFHPIDCGAVASTLFESELFGHASKAFNDAKARLGAIRTADKGTLLLDEIANLDLTLQEKLLRTIQVSKVQPVGADAPVPFDVRWLGATNRSLDDEQRFLPDLRDRLLGFRAVVPPLRDRREDLGTLVAHALRHAGATRPRITKRAARELFLHPFPGNVRQLDKVLRSASILAGEDAIDLPHLVALETGTATVAPPAGTAAGRRKCPERHVVQTALAAAGGTQGAAARILGVDEKQLRRWMDSLGIERARRKGP